MTHRQCPFQSLGWMSGFSFSAELFFIPFKIDINEFERDSNACWEESDDEVAIKARGFGKFEKAYTGGLRSNPIPIQQCLRKSFAEVIVIIDI